MVTSSTSAGSQDVIHDPEVIAGIFIVGGILTVLGFIAYRLVITIGQDLESPAPIQALRRAILPPEVSR